MLERETVEYDSQSLSYRLLQNIGQAKTANDLFAFLTTAPNKEVTAIHPKAMPVILKTPDEIEKWMTAPTEEALKLQRPLPHSSLQIVARGSKKDESWYRNFPKQSSDPMKPIVNALLLLASVVLIALTLAPILRSLID